MRRARSWHCSSVVEIERTGDTYVARDGARQVWTVELRLDLNGSPFREEKVWPAAEVVAIGGGDAVHFLALETGASRRTLVLEGDRFGGFGEARDVLYVLGWRHVVAVACDLATRWVSHDVAIDGIVWRGVEADRIQLSAEMDPPGGWVDVELDAATGRELSRSNPHPCA